MTTLTTDYVFSIFIIKARIFDILINSSSLYIFYIHDHTYCKQQKDSAFF